MALGGEDEPSTRDALSRLAALHREVDVAAGALAERHGPRLKCKKGCADCCVDDLTVFTLEAERIRAAHGALLQADEPHPTGRCAFLDDVGACRIYEDRPYVCRTQGLPLRWEDEDEAGTPVEMRDICVLNEAGEPPLVSLPTRDCWTLGPFEGRLATLQVTWSGAPDRVRLRDLFGT